MIYGGDVEIRLLTFLEKTKEGVYASIDDASMPYVRLGEVTETIDIYEQEYYYNTYSRLPGP